MVIFQTIAISFLIAGFIDAAPSKKSFLRDLGMFQRNQKCDCVCGLSNRQQRVVGGEVTKLNEFPWLVGLSKDGEFYCGATLISQRHLLTAAHCVAGFNIKHITAIFGDWDRESSDRFSRIQVRTIKSVKQHEDFDLSTYNNDIAILELNELVDFNAGIQPACLPSSDEDFTGKLALVAGWGRTGERQETSKILLKTTVPIWSKTECIQSDYGEFKISENMFCAGYPKGQKDACQGDSGGPLQVYTSGGNMEVVGIVSWGRGCARPNLPGIYTKLTNYLDWINNSLDCLCQPPISNPRRA